MARKSQPLTASLVTNVGGTLGSAFAKRSGPRGKRSPKDESFSIRFNDPKMRELLGQGRSVKIVAHVGPGLRAAVEDVRVEPATESLEARDSLSAALLRGRERVSSILAGPGMLTGEQMAKRIGTSRVTVNTKRKSGELLGLVGNVRGHKYPDWQLREDGRPYPALRHIAKRLAGDVWTVYRFLVQPHEELDGATGIEALRDGRDQEVLEAAESIARAYG